MSGDYNGKLAFWNKVRQIPKLFELLCPFCATLENINYDSCQSMAFCGSCRSRLNKSGHELVACESVKQNNKCTNPVYIGPFNRAKYCKICASSDICKFE
jgi:hypothetical protein